MIKKNKFVFLLILVLSFLVTINKVSASATVGVMDSTYHYAWGENVGWVDFANVQVTETGLLGSVYGENIGWIDLSTIKNSLGALSSYAWGENVGWVDFSKVSIGTGGVFAGSAYGENIGWISFGTGENKVVTDWVPPNTGGGSLVNNSGNTNGGGSYVPSPVVSPAPLIPPVGSSGGTPVDCKIGEKFSTTSGLPCTTFIANSTSTCVITQTLKQGSKGEEVKCLQIKLLTTPDGKFGKKTKQVVVVFQKNHNLKPDGIVGHLTRDVINLSN